MAACTEAVSMLPSFKDSLRPQATSELESLVTEKIGSLWNQRDDIDSEMQALIKSSFSLLISMTEVTLVDSARLAKNGNEKDVKCKKVETRLRESIALLNVLTVLVAQ
eukprot:1166743-Amphidinium_carterae.1